MKKRIRDLVDGRLDELAQEGDVWHPDWIAQHVCRRYQPFLPQASTDAATFYEYSGYTTVRAIVADAIRKRTDSTDLLEDQLEFEGFPRVQAYYGIERDGERVGVPVLAVRGAERRAKLAELRRTADALYEHAEQLELFWELNPPAVA